MPGVLISIESLYIVQIWQAKWPLKFSEHLGSDASLPGNPLGGFIDVSGLLFQDGPNVKRKGTILLYIYISYIYIIFGVMGEHGKTRNIYHQHTINYPLPTVDW